MTDGRHLYDPEVPAEVGNRTAVSRRGRRVLAAIIVILLLALAGVSVLLVGLVTPRAGVAPREETGGIVWVKSIYGWGSTPDTQFIQPQKVDIAEDGTIWVSDGKYKDGVLAFDPEGRLVATVGQEAEDPLRAPGPVALGPGGEVLIGEPVLDRLRLFGPDGEDLGTVSIPNPIDIAYRDETLVVGSTSGFAILDPATGTPVQVVGDRGREDDQFDVVNGVAIGPDGSIYVTDAYNNRLSKYDSAGERIWMVPTGAPGNTVDVSGGEVMAASRETTIAAAMQLPGGLCLDASGRIVVADSLDFTLAVFDAADGSFIGKYGDYGALDGQFVYPTSVKYDPSRDWFVVADTGNSRVQIVRIPGSSPGIDVVAAARRTLAGPVRACLPPIALLLAIIVAAMVRSRKQKKEAGRARV